MQDCPDPRRAVFEAAIDFLGAHGIAEARARSLVGKWRQIAGDTAIFEALCKAHRAAVSDPVAWITQVLKPHSQGNGAAANSDFIEWLIGAGVPPGAVVVMTSLDRATYSCSNGQRVTVNKPREFGVAEWPKEIPAVGGDQRAGGESRDRLPTEPGQAKPGDASR